MEITECSSRYEDVEAMLKDDRHFVLDFPLALDSDQLPQLRQDGPDVMAMVDNHLLTKEGPDHRRLRSFKKSESSDGWFREYRVGR